MRKKYDIIEDIIIYHYSLYSIPNYLEQFSILGLTVCVVKNVCKNPVSQKFTKKLEVNSFFCKLLKFKTIFSCINSISIFCQKKKIENGRSVYYYHTAYSLHCSYLYSKQLYVQKSADVCKSALKKLFPFYDHKF